MFNIEQGSLRGDIDLPRQTKKVLTTSTPNIDDAESTGFRVLRLLHEKPDAKQRQIAEALGISLGGVNYCLRALIDRGLVKAKNFKKSPNKLGYMYLLTPRGLAHKSSMAAAFLRLRMAEYEALRAEIAAVEAEIKNESLERQFSEVRNETDPWRNAKGRARSGKQ